MKKFLLILSICFLSLYSSESQKKAMAQAKAVAIVLPLTNGYMCDGALNLLKVRHADLHRLQRQGDTAGVKYMTNEVARIYGMIKDNPCILSNGTHIYIAAAQTLQLKK